MLENQFERMRQLGTPSTTSILASNSADILLLEQQKENIQPLPQGRSASKLSTAFRETAATTLHKHNMQLQKEREKFESDLKMADELDDPLQLYVDYIDWTHNNYPQGANVDSGLVLLLERCTSSLRDIPSYKNDARYLKIWLEYTNYSDSPRDIFVYLAKKEIGNQLALYYESFATYLELNNKLTDAEQIYQLGIQSNARPLPRLQRSYNSFRSRLAAGFHRVPENTPQVVRDVLAIKSGRELASSDSSGNRHPQYSEDQGPSKKKQKLDIFKDSNEDQNQSVLYSIFGSVSADEDLKLGSTKTRTKENVITAKKWAGETLKQKIPLSRPGSDGSGKIQVFRDIEDPPSIKHQPSPVIDEVKIDTLIHVDNRELAYTKVEVTGKKTEMVMVNMELVYQDDEEYTFDEILALSRRKYNMSKRMRCRPDDLATLETVTQAEQQPDDKCNQTLIIRMKGVDDTTLLKVDQTIREPTMTMYSKMADNEVAFMYRGGTADSDDDGDLPIPQEETNYEGFVTETITVSANQPQIQQSVNQKILTPKVTPPTEDEASCASSPFIEQPPESSESTHLINPFDDRLKEQLLNMLPIPLSAFSGYYDRSSLPPVKRMRKFREITASRTKKINRGSQQAIIDYCGDEIYCVIHELGQGGYGFVYLIENGSNGTLRALKIESPSSKWEFYILRSIHRRLLDQPNLLSLFIHAESLFYFQDESFLILDYHSQSTLLDVVNYYNSQEHQHIPEILCIYLTVELLRSIETLHQISIIHADLKADNCMVRFEPVEESEWPDEYNPNNAAWSKKSITLIDFGRGIDLSLFPQHTRFTSGNMKVDEQDCVEMNEGTPWSYEADYYGLAGIVHSLLFGSYIRIIKHDGRVRLKSSFKRYWQIDLWDGLFNVLLNPYDHETKTFEPRIDHLRNQRELFQAWLQKNSRKQDLKRIILGLENGLNSINKKRLT